MILVYSTAGKEAFKPRSSKGVTEMEVKDAITLMLLFGMFILTLLAYMKKK